LETAVNCIWDSRVSIGDRVVVLGAGVVGLLIAWLCSKVLAEVTVIEPSKVRRQAARDLGLTSVAEPSDGEFDADVVVEASGSPEVLDRAVMCAGQAARVIVVSNYGARRHALNLGDRFHRRRLTIQSSQVSSIPADRVARWSIQRRFETVERLLHEPMLDRLVDHVVGFSQAPDVYRQLDQRAGDWLQTVFVYRDQPTMAPPTPSRTIECTR
jgi:threonine dehydrogenase-like Zn-dependent dehydrogenase